MTGAFSLVRFRSTPGSANEISNVFLAMAIGIATGIGNVLFAGIFLIIFETIYIFYMKLNIGINENGYKSLKITIPENLYKSDIFDDVFSKYTEEYTLVNIKTTNMGSLYKICYKLTIKKGVNEKEIIDDIRCRNGNLEVSIGLFENNNSSNL